VKQEAVTRDEENNLAFINALLIYGVNTDKRGKAGARRVRDL
jgi:hypothetical protein